MSERRYDVMSFGEAMIRFTALNHMRLYQTDDLKMAVSAAELSVAANTSMLGLKTAWISKLVDTWSGDYIIAKGLSRGVDMSHIVKVPYDGVGWTRNGFAFIEVGIGPRASKMVYDRGHSAISKIKPGDFDWDELMKQTKWFHTTGITPALSDGVAQETLSALKAAKKNGVKTSIDLNYRSTLWSAEKAQSVIKELLKYVDVLIGNEEDFETCVGIKAAGTTNNFSKINPESYRSVAEKAMEMYPNIELVATSLRDAKTGLLNDWQTAMLYKGGFYISRKYEDMEIMDRIGGGDSFASAMIYGLITEKEPQDMIDFAAAYSALCHGFLGDWNWATREEAEHVMKGGSARVKR